MMHNAYTYKILQLNCSFFDSAENPRHMRLRLPHLQGCAVAAALCSSDDQQNQWQNGNFDPAVA